MSIIGDRGGEVPHQRNDRVAGGHRTPAEIIGVDLERRRRRGDGLGRLHRDQPGLCDGAGQRGLHVEHRPDQRHVADGGVNRRVAVQRVEQPCHRTSSSNSATRSGERR